MHYVYVLESKKDNRIYLGCTNNLKRRVELHNAGKVPSTTRRLPVKVIHYEAFINKKDAFSREQWLKTGWGRSHLRKVLSNYYLE